MRERCEKLELLYLEVKIQEKFNNETYFIILFLIEPVLKVKIKNQVSQAIFKILKTYIYLILIKSIFQVKNRF